MGMYTSVPQLRVEQQDPLAQYGRLVALQQLQADAQYQQQLRPMELQAQQNQLQIQQQTMQEQEQARQQQMHDLAVQQQATQAARGTDNNGHTTFDYQKYFDALYAGNASSALIATQTKNHAAAADAVSKLSDEQRKQALNLVDDSYRHFEAIRGSTDPQERQRLVGQALSWYQQSNPNPDPQAMQKWAQMAMTDKGLGQIETQVGASEQLLRDEDKRAALLRKQQEQLFGSGAEGDRAKTILAAQGITNPNPQQLDAAQKQVNQERRIDPRVIGYRVLGDQREYLVVDPKAPGGVGYATPNMLNASAQAGTPLGAPQYNPDVQAGLTLAKEAVSKVPVIQTTLHHLDQMKAANAAYKRGDLKALGELAKAYNIQVGDTSLATYRGLQQVIQGDILAASSAVGTKNEKEEAAINAITDPANPERANDASIDAVRQLMNDRLKAKGEVYRDVTSGNIGNVFRPQTGGATKTGAKTINYKIVNGQLVPQ